MTQRRHAASVAERDDASSHETRGWRYDHGPGGGEGTLHLGAEQAGTDSLGAELEWIDPGQDDVDFYRQVVESAPDGIVVIDGEGVIRVVNEQAERMLGWDRRRLVGQHLEVLVPERVASRHPALRDSFLRSPRTRPMGAGLDLTVRRADGSELPVDISLSPLMTRDNGTWVSAALRDATVRKRAEAELRNAYTKLSATAAEMEQRGRELALVGEMGDMLQSCLDGEEAHGVAAAYMDKLFPSSIGAIYRPISSRSILQSGSHWGKGGSDLPATVNGNDCWALRRGRPHRTVGEAGALRCRHDVPRGAAWNTCVPLLAHGEVLGLLQVVATAGGGSDAPSTSDDVLTLAVSVAEHLSLALANLALRDSLKAQSERDSLTGLYNRRRLEQALEEQAFAAAQTGEELSLLIADVDLFKTVNDLEGHTSGDGLLRTLAHLLLREARGGDTVCRLGGDEFAVLLPSCGGSTAAERAEQFRAAAERELPTTISIGVATLLPGQASTDQLMQTADLCLYRAKAQGRNCVVGPVLDAAQDGAAPARDLPPS